MSISVLVTIIIFIRKSMIIKGTNLGKMLSICIHAIILMVY